MNWNDFFTLFCDIGKQGIFSNLDSQTIPFYLRPGPNHSFNQSYSPVPVILFWDCKQLHNMQNISLRSGMVISFPDAPLAEDWRFGHDHDSPYPCSFEQRGIHQEGLIGIQDAVTFWSFRRPWLPLSLGYLVLGERVSLLNLTYVQCCSMCLSVAVPSNISTNDSEKLEDRDQRIRDMPQGQTHDKTSNTPFKFNFM